VDLRLHHIERPGQLLGGGHGFFNGQGGDARGMATPYFASSSLA
jgi:hypothetical protein